MLLAALTAIVTVLACKRADGQWNTRPGGETIVQAGSQLITLGTFEQLQKVIGLARGGTGAAGSAAT